MNTNDVMIAGEIITDFSYDHEAFGEGFYKACVAVDRLNNGVQDYILLIASERLLDINKSHIGQIVSVKGQFRSYNYHENGEDKSKLVLHVFAKELIFVDKKPKENNVIVLDGYICKKPIYRVTPSGRKITDLLLAVNRAYEKSDYLPCICWGRNARYAAGYQLGSHIQIMGRIQSREYTKKYENMCQKKTAYEVSISGIQNLD